MIHFVIPFKSKAVSRDWSLDSFYCLRTIKSLLNQTIDAYTVTIACHQRPDGFEEVEPHPNVRLIERPDFWLPSDLSRKNGLRVDKDRKLRAAMASLRGFQSGLIMPLDADDLVHVEIAEYVLNRPSIIDLFFADKGYIYDQSLGVLLAKNEMHRRTGTSLIFRWEAKDLPESENDKEKPVIFTADHGGLDHSQVVDKATGSGPCRVEAIPFASVCYVVGTGVQLRGGGFNTDQTLWGHSQNAFGALLRFWQLRYPTTRWCKDFGLQ